MPARCSGCVSRGADRPRPTPSALGPGTQPSCESREQRHGKGRLDRLTSLPSEQRGRRGRGGPTGPQLQALDGPRLDAEFSPPPPCLPYTPPETGTSLPLRQLVRRPGSRLRLRGRWMPDACWAAHSAALPSTRIATSPARCPLGLLADSHRASAPTAVRTYAPLCGEDRCGPVGGGRGRGRAATSALSASAPLSPTVKKIPRQLGWRKP